MNSGPQISPTSYFPLGNLSGGGLESNLDRGREGEGTILSAVSPLLIKINVVKCSIKLQ